MAEGLEGSKSRLELSTSKEILERSGAGLGGPVLWTSELRGQSYNRRQVLWPDPATQESEARGWQAKSLFRLKSECKARVSSA